MKMKMKTLDDLREISRTKRGHNLVNTQKVETGELEADGKTPLYRVEFINPPENFILREDVVDGACILEDLDYVEPQ